MSTDRYQTSTSTSAQSAVEVVDIETSSPSRYVWAGIATVLTLILLCTLAVALLGQGLSNRGNVVPTPAPGSDARVEVSGPLAASAPFSVRGTGFQPGENVEIFITTDPNLPFDQFTKLGDATAGSDGSFQAVGLVSPATPGDYFLIARGSSSGFTTPFTPITVGGTALPVVTDTPSNPTPTVGPPTPAGPLPDLILVSVSIQLQTGNSCSYVSNQLGINVVVQNVGSASAGPFLIQANNQQQLVQGGLAPGQTTALWFPGYSTGSNLVIVDPTNLVNEANEGNNQFDGPLPVPTLPATCTPPAGPTVIVVTPTPDPNVTGAWYAQYFGNQDLIPPVLFDQNRPGPFLNANFGTNSPGPGVPRNGWSAIFTSNQQFPSTDNFLFTLTVDGGARVYVDNVLIINQWFNGALRTVTANRSVTAGVHSLRVEFYKSNPTARVALNWAVSYTGWEGRYYNSPNLDGPIVTKQDDPVSPPNPPGFLDSALFVSWPPPGVNPFNFSVDWRRTVVFPIAGTYVFTAVVDDGARLLIDGSVVPTIDDFTAGAKVLSGSRALSAGQHFLELQYVNYTGPANIKLTWALVPIPPTNTPTPTGTLPPTNTPTNTPTPSNTPTPTETPTPTPTVPTPTPTDTPTPTSTFTPTPTVPTPTPTDTPTPTPTSTDTPTPTLTPTSLPITVIVVTLPPPTPTP